MGSGAPGAVPAQELALPAEKLVVPEEPDEKCGWGESPCPKQISASGCCGGKMKKKPKPPKQL